MELLREKIREEINKYASDMLNPYATNLIDADEIVVDRIIGHIKAAMNSEGLQTQEFLDE